MNTEVVIPDDLEKFYQDKNIIWDFKNNPCLFPLYLFQNFHLKYCEGEKVEKEQSAYYSRKSVYCYYKDPSLPPKYEAWFIVSTKWNHVSFFFQIGKQGFKPFTNEMEYASGLISYIHIQVFAEKINIHANISSCSDFTVLFSSSKIGKEITEEMKKYELSAETF